MLELIRYVGGMTRLTIDAGGWVCNCMVGRSRLGLPAISLQLLRLGAGAIGVIVLVTACIGLILALQMAPPLAEFGQTARVADIIAIAVVRELGPLVSAIVLTGFAGAAVAAELGTMVVGEEVEALEAHALNPVRFLVVPRLAATIIATAVLSVIGTLTAVCCGWAISVTLLQLSSSAYIADTLNRVDLADVVTGLVKSLVFGALIGAIACYNGMAVTGGAAGVGSATTRTVVHSLVSIIVSDFIFTAVFYRLGLT